VDIDEFAHAVGIVHGGAPFGDFDLAPGPMGVEGDEQIDGAVAVLVIVAPVLSRLGWDQKTRICKVPEGEFDFLGYTFGRMYSAKTGQARSGLAHDRPNSVLTIV